MGNPWTPQFDSASTSPSSTRPSSPEITQLLVADLAELAEWASKMITATRVWGASLVGKMRGVTIQRASLGIIVTVTQISKGTLISMGMMGAETEERPSTRNSRVINRAGGAVLFDANIDDPNAADEKPRVFNQQDLRKAIKLPTGWRIAIWASRRRVARADLPGLGPRVARKFTVEEWSQLPLLVKVARNLSRTVIHANVARPVGISIRERSLIYMPFSDRTLNALIYMPFSDRTLHDSLHNSPSDRRPSWEERLKIALGTARGLAFAHWKGLYHGNVKSTNILLDEKCNCKLVEFGVARVWSKNTLLNSSRGYVDEEYMNSGTNQLIASMDVYSFGVLLVELITGRDPSSEEFNQRRRRSLALVFISAVDEGRLQEVVDHNIWAEERNEQLLSVADLAKECLQQGVKGRPKMVRVRNILSKWVPKGPGPQAQGGRPTNAAGSRPRVARNSNLQDQIENAQSQAQSALDVGQNITAEFET